MANEKRLIDAKKLFDDLADYWGIPKDWDGQIDQLCEDALCSIENAPTVDAVEVVHGKWILTAHEEYANYRWKVTAECSECHRDKGEVYAAFISGFHTDIARDIVLEYAESVKLDNYCPNCGAKMDGDGNG